jgi:hypothetical protein
MPGELVLRVEAGKVTFTKSGSDTAKKNGNEPPPAGKGASSGKGKAGNVESTVSVEAFLNGLPDDSFTPAEDALREALLGVLANGPLPTSQAKAHKEVLPSLRSFLPRSVQLQAWVESRIGAEVTAYEEGGIDMFRLNGNEPEQEASSHAQQPQVDPVQAGEDERISFFASLPADSFSQEEETLRLAIFDFLALWRSKDLATLAHAEANKGVQSARDAFLPQVVPLKEWMEARIGGEVSLETNGKVQDAIKLDVAARKIVTDRYKELEAKRKAEEKPMTQAQRQAFLASLPSDDLKEEELRLRQVLVDLVGSRPRTPFGEVLALPAVKAAQKVALPATFPLEEWIEERVGGEIDVSKDERGKLVLSARQPDAPEEPAARSGMGAAAGKKGGGKRVEDDVPKVTPAELERRKEVFFNKLPSDSFSPAEESLREALLNFLVSWHQAGPPTLSQAEQDLGFASKKRELLPKGCSVSLQEWIDKRIGGEVDTRQIDRGVVFARLGELDEMLAADNSKGGGKKRKADALGGPAGNAKGKSKTTYSRSGR